MGYRLPRASTSSFAGKVAPACRTLQAALEPVLAALGVIEASIQALDRRVEEMCRDRYPETALLRGRCAGWGRSRP